MALTSVCVYCGSARGSRASYAALARDLAGELARRGLTLVYGGASIGLMGILADAVLEAGGRVVGVIPRRLVERELAHPRLSVLHVTETMHERKARMAELADAFIALPGGAGTLDELFEIWTWAQLGLHRKPCGLLDADGYYRGLLGFLDHATGEGFLRPEHRALLHVAGSAAELIELLERHAAPGAPGARLEET